MIAVVALLVIGPEKLPKLARTLGAYTGRMQRFVAQVKDEVNREVRFEELQKLQQEVQSATVKAESSILASVDAIQRTTIDTSEEPAIQRKPTRKKGENPKVDALAIKSEDLSETNKRSVKARRAVATEKSEVVSQTKPTRARKKAVG